MKNQETLLQCAKPLLTALRDDIGVSVGIATLTPDKTQGKILHVVPGKKQLTFTPNPGFTFPIHVSAPTKAMLAMMEREDREEIVDGLEFPALTARSITDKSLFLKELERDRKRKYSVDNGEHVEGINCVGAAVLDGNARPIAGIWVTSLSLNLPRSDFKKAAPKVIAAAVKISQELSKGTLNSAFYINEVVEQAEQYLTHHFEDEINMEEFAEKLHVGYSSFRKKFKEKTGKTLNRYLLDLRIEETKKLLSETHFSMSKIAEKTGYKNQHYFSLQFKKEAGISPSHFRRNAGG